MRRNLLTFLFLALNINVFARLFFIENLGQWNENIFFKSEFTGGVLNIENGTFNYNFYDVAKLNELVGHHHKFAHYHEEADWTVNAHCMKVNFLNAQFQKQNLNFTKPITEYFNYYIGNEPSKWASKVPAFNSLYFKNIYSGIDLEIKGQNHSFKYDIIVRPTGKTLEIVLQYEGAKNMKIDEKGHLLIETNLNTIKEHKPYAYQTINGKNIEVKCHYQLRNNEISFDLPNGYNKNYDLIIDPFIVFSRYSGSTANNFGYTATYDSEENAFGAGSVFGIGYQTTPGVFDIYFNGGMADVGITKYTPDGLNRIYSTYLGGNETELPHSLVVNSRDELFVFGTTSSLNFPTSANAFDNTYNGGQFANFSNGLGVNYNNGSDIFISRFSADGTTLLASTLLGGNANDGLNTSYNFLHYNYADEIRGEILIDANDNCYIVTCTYSDNFPIVNGFQSNYNGGLEGVIVKMDENLSQILWSSFLGGSDDDAIFSLVFDTNENLIVAGGTRSLDFPVNNAIQNNFGGGRADGFITKIHPSGSGILSSTYYGTNSYDQIYFIDLNDENEVYVFGQTTANTGLLIENANYNKPNGGQLLTKFTPEIDSVIWSTRFGGQSGIPDISPTAFLVDVCDQVFLSGWGGQGLGGNNNISGTQGLDITPNAVQSNTDNSDFYFMVLRSDASELIYGSFFGGSQSQEHVDGGTSRFDKKGVVYQAVCAGCGNNQDFPTVPADSIGTWSNNNSCNLGVVKYAFAPPTVIADFSVPPVDCTPLELNFLNQSQTAFNDTSVATFLWTVNDSLIESYHLNYFFENSGNYTIKLVAIDSSSCNFADSISKEITIIGNGSSTLQVAETCSGVPIQIGVTPINSPNETYTWSPEVFLNNSNISNPLANPTENIEYTLIISNNNCFDTIIQPVIVTTDSVDIFVRENICTGDTVTISATDIVGAIYTWNPPNFIENGQGTSVAIFVFEESSQVSVSAVNNIGCVAQNSIFINIITDLPDLQVSAFPDTINYLDTAQLLATSLDLDDFLWNESESLSAINIENPVAFPLETTTYTVNVNDGDCPNNKPITIFVRQAPCIEGRIFIPNAFTPNNDGNNDIFRARSSIEISDFKLAIYDRWGEPMFQTFNIEEGWDGTFKGIVQSPSVYGWYAEGVCPNGEPFFLKGNVTLIR